MRLRCVLGANRGKLYKRLRAARRYSVGNKLCWVDGTKFVYDGVVKGTVTAGKKSMAEYFGIILIFPDKKYYNYNTDTFGTIPNCPDIKYICVHNNRAFGVGGNGFYASKLGDPLTWNYFHSAVYGRFILADKHRRPR